jgi:hypothetical protein
MKGSQKYLDAVSFDSYAPDWATAYPFYYNPADIYDNDGCAEGPVGGPCTTYMTDDYTLWFYDVPNDQYCAPPAPCLGFQTQLVGICDSASPVCNSSGPSAPLFEWTWYSNYNGSAGGIYEEGAINVFPPDPGSGTGGITVTSINGVPTPTVTVTPSATSITTAQGVTATIAVSGASGSPTATGSVTLTSGSYTSGATVLSGGGATISIPAGTLATGSDTLAAVYTPDNASAATFSQSSGFAVVTVTAPLLTPTVAVTPASMSITTLQPLSVTVTVNGGSGNPTPTGTVTLTSGSYDSAATTLSGGSAQINIPAGSLAAGSDTLMATYTPDSNSSSTYTIASGAASSPVNVSLATPVITWNPVSTIIYGSAGSNVRNASANTGGSFTYSATPTGGGSPIDITSSTAALAAGSYNIAANFTPTDPTTYSSAQSTAVLVVSGESVWIVDGSGGTSELAGNGAGITSSADPGANRAVAIDGSGNVWTAGSGSPLLEETSQTGTTLNTISSGTGGLNSPAAIAIDGDGQAWVTNGNNSVSLFSNAGTALSPSTGFTDSSLSAPSGIAIDLSGSVWIANKGNNSVTRILGAAAPAAPLATAAANKTTGEKP